MGRIHCQAVLLPNSCCLFASSQSILKIVTVVLFKVGRAMPKKVGKESILEGWIVFHARSIVDTGGRAVAFRGGQKRREKFSTFSLPRQRFPTFYSAVLVCLSHAARLEHSVPSRTGPARAAPRRVLQIRCHCALRGPADPSVRTAGPGALQPAAEGGVRCCRECGWRSAACAGRAVRRPQSCARTESARG